MLGTVTRQSDRVLLDAARAGDNEALATLYRRYNAMAEARIRAELADSPADPSDITHQAWADLINGVRSGKAEIENLPAYLATVIRRNLARHKAATDHDSFDRITENGITPEPARAASAESTFYDQSLAIIQRSIRRPESDPQTPYASTVTAAAAIAQLHGFDTPIARPTNALRRALAGGRDQDDLYETIVAAVRARIGLTTKAFVPPPYDPQVMEMFAEWSLTDLEALLHLPQRHLVCLVIGAVIFPTRPSEPARRVLRAKLAGLSSVPGWTKASRALEKAWIAEWFQAQAHHDRTRDPQVAEQERCAMAVNWPAAADSALAFPGRPLGRSVTTRDDVHQRLTRLLHARQ